MSDLQLRIKLLELQVAALRSVLSEFEGDKMEYCQMNLANQIEALLLCLK